MIMTTQSDTRGVWYAYINEEHIGTIVTIVGGRMFAVPCKSGREIVPCESINEGVAMLAMMHS